MKGKNYIYIVFSICLVFSSCRKNIDDLEVIPPNTVPIKKVVASVHGNVTDDKSNAISGAIVTLGNEIAETDENGVFQFIGKSLNKNGTYLSVKKEGYFNGSRRFYPTVATTSIVRIELIPHEISGSFNSGAASVVENEGVTLDFPPNAIVDENGASYDGLVNVAVAYLDPTNINTLDQMPGDLSGTETDGDLVALKSLGMIAVELMDASGNKLQVKDGNRVNVEIPIPEELQANAPSTIPMWHFNEDIGVWQEEGFADLVGNNYETSLSHFSFWNCDIPREYSFLKGSILNREIPIQGVKVEVCDLDNNASGYAITDEGGMFCGYVPGDEELVLKVYNSCGEVIYTATFTTYEELTILDPINLNLFSELVSVSGTVSNCDGELSQYAYVKARYGTQIFTFPVNENGSFYGHVTYCSGLDILYISAQDPILGIYSGRFEYTIEGDLMVDNMELCASEDLEEYIIIEYGNVKRDLVFDDRLNIDLILKENLSGEPFVQQLTIKYEIAPDSIITNQIYSVHVPPYDQTTFVDVHESGFRARDPSADEVIFQNGKEYLKMSGVLTDIGALLNQTYDQSITSLYFDLLIKTN